MYSTERKILLNNIQINYNILKQDNYLKSRILLFGDTRTKSNESCLKHKVFVEDAFLIYISFYEIYVYFAVWHINFIYLIKFCKMHVLYSIPGDCYF